MSIESTSWAGVEVATSAVMIGIPIGLHGAAGASLAPLRKRLGRQKGIGHLGISAEGGIALSRVLAAPVLHCIMQFYPADVKARAMSALGSQALIRSYVATAFLLWL